MFEPLIIPNDKPAPLAEHLATIDATLIEEGRQFVAENPIRKLDAIDAEWVEQTGSRNSEIAEIREAVTTDPRPYLAYGRAVRLGGAESYYHCTYARLLSERTLLPNHVLPPSRGWTRRLSGRPA